METKITSTQNTNSVHFLVARLKRKLANAKDVNTDLENILAETEQEWNNEMEMRVAYEVDNRILSGQLKSKDDTITTLIEMVSNLTKENARLKALMNEQ